MDTMACFSRALSRINLFAIHYFLWFAAISSIYGTTTNSTKLKWTTPSFINVYSKHYANSTASQYGLLNMILPFVTIASKIVFCSLADRHRAYRTFFIVFLTCALIGYGSFAVLPFLITEPNQSDGLHRGTFAVICVMTSIATISMSVLSCLSDAFAMNSSKKYNISYGHMRLWGTIGWGVSSLLLAFINQFKELPYLVPGLIMTIILISLDIYIASTWKNKDDFKLDKSASDVNFQDVITVLHQERSIVNHTDQVATDESRPSSLEKNSQNAKNSYGTASTESWHAESISKQDIGRISASHETIDISSVRMQWILFKQVAGRRRSIFRYMTLFTISGALISLQWSYFFNYLEKIHENDFFFLSGLSMFGQSMLGELPFFILSQHVIQILGRSHSLSISIASIGLRYLLYAHLLPSSSMYFVLVTEMFQGPNFGLFYVIMTEVGLDFSDCEEAIVSVVAQGLVANDLNQIEKLRQALRATMQSLMSACYEGLGVGIGSIIGGLVIDYYDFYNLWLYASLISLALGLINLLIDVSGIQIFKDNNPKILLKT